MQPFSVAVVDVFGVPQVHNLKEGGDEIIVTNDTRQVINQTALHSLCSHFEFKNPLTPLDLI